MQEILMQITLLLGREAEREWAGKMVRSRLQALDECEGREFIQIGASGQVPVNRFQFCNILCPYLWQRIRSDLNSRGLAPLCGECGFNAER